MGNDTASFNSIMFWSNSKLLDKLTQLGAVEEICGYTADDFQKNHTLWFEMMVEHKASKFFSASYSISIADSSPRER